MSAASKSPATAETLIALGDAPFEVIDGERTFDAIELRVGLLFGDE